MFPIIYHESQEISVDLNYVGSIKFLIIDMRAYACSSRMKTAGSTTTPPTMYKT